MKEQGSRFNLDRLREIAKPATPHKRLTPEDREKAMKTLLPEYIRKNTLIEYLKARKKDITLKMIPGQEDPVMYGKLTMCKEIINKLNDM